MQRRFQTTKKEDSEMLADSITEICRRSTINRMTKLLSMLTPDNLELLQIDEQSKEKVLYNLLQLPEKHRNADMIAILIRLLAGMDFIGKMKESYSQRAVDELCKGMKSSFECVGRHLIKIGEESDRLFFIIKGEVLVLYPRLTVDVERQSVGREEMRGNTRINQILTEFAEKSPFRGIPVDVIQNYQSLFNNYGVPMYQVEASLTKGQSFGELGIIYRQKRMAHIICRTDCEFGSLSAQQYLRIISNKWQAGRIHSKLLFLEKHFYSELGKLDLREAQRFVYLFSPQEFKVNSQIVTLHSPIRGAYILVEGSIVIKRESTSLENYATQVSDLNFLMRSTRHRGRNLHEVRKLVSGDCFGLTEIVTNNGICDRIFFEYEAVAASNCKLLFCPEAKLLKILTEDSKLEVQLKKKARQQLQLLKQATFGCVKLNNKEQANVGRYYLDEQHQQSNCADRVLRSIPKRTGVLKCDHTGSPAQIKERPFTIEHHTAHSLMRRATSMQRNSARLRKSKMISTMKADSSIGLMRMSTTNIKRILADPFSYY